MSKQKKTKAPKKKHKHECPNCSGKLIDGECVNCGYPNEDIMDDVPFDINDYNDYGHEDDDGL